MSWADASDQPAPLTSQQQIVFPPRQFVQGGSGSSGGGSNRAYASTSRTSSRGRNVTELSSERVFGTITSCKENFAFISANGRDADVFLHYSNVKTPRPNASETPYQRGDTVAFTLKLDNETRREFAANVEYVESAPPPTPAPAPAALPSMNGVDEEIVERDLSGVIERELIGGSSRSNQRRDRRVEAYGGKVRRVTAGDDVDVQTVFEFAERDLYQPQQQLCVGDEVSFDVFTEKQSQRRGATHIKLTRMNPTERLRGFIRSVKDDKRFGFIRIDRDELRAKSTAFHADEVFFHFSEFIDRTRTPQADDEVEFTIEQDSTNGRVCAGRILALPKGTLTQQTVSAQLFSGTVVKELQPDTAANEPATNTDKPARTLLVNGAIEYTFDGATCTLPFTSRDLRHHHITVIRGDKVTFNLLVKGEVRSARNIAVAADGESKDGRDGGRIVTINEKLGFAFIESATRPDRIFLHASNVRTLSEPAVSDGRRNPFYVGMEVEYNVLSDGAGKYNAVRAVQVPDGTVSFDTTTQERYDGVIIRDAKKKSFNSARFAPDRRDNAAAVGQIRRAQSVDGESDVVSFTADDVSSGTPLNVNDRVSFNIRTQRRTNNRSAANITLVQSASRERGVIVKLKSDRIKLMSAQRIPLLTADYSALIDPNIKDALVEGDCVEFTVADNERKSVSAIALLPKDSVTVERAQRSVIYSGTVSAVPLRPNNRTTGRAAPGTILVTAVKHVSHPTYYDLQTQPVTQLDTFDAARHQPALIDVPSPFTIDNKLVGTQIEFKFAAINNRSFLSKGDAVRFLLSERLGLDVHQATNVTLQPLEGRITALSLPSGLGHDGLIAVTARTTTETFQYDWRDVSDDPNALCVGDVVSIGNAAFDGETRKRTAKSITFRGKNNAKVQSAPTRVKSALTNVVGGATSGRYALGPTAPDSKGFASRKPQNKQNETPQTQSQTPMQTNGEGANGNESA